MMINSNWSVIYHRCLLQYFLPLLLLISNIKLNAQVHSQIDLNAPQFLQKGPTNESTMIVLPSGMLKIFYINRPGKADKMMSISSSDEGRHWTAPETEFELPGEAYYANQVMVDREGNIHCIFHLYSIGNLGYKGKQLDLWYACKNPGKSWSTPRKIWDGYVGSLRSFLQLKNGNLLIPMSESDTARAKKPIDGTIDFGLFQVITLLSSDGGQHWVKSPQPIKIPIESSQVTRYGAVEPCAIERKDGSIWMLIRTNKGRLFESFSEDGGLNWGPARPSAFISSDSPADLLRLSNGKIIIFWNSDQRYDDTRSYANGGREALHAAITNDEGQTWKGFREILKSAELYGPARGDRGTAYPSAVETHQGKIVVVSGQGSDPSIVGFDAKWLEEVNQESKNLTISDSTRTFVWNFPFRSNATMTISLELPEDMKGIGVGFMDHFSASIDTLATKQAPLYFFIENSLQKPLTIRCRWNAHTHQVKITANGKKMTNFSLQKNEFAGFNYLRLEKGMSNSADRNIFIRALTLY